MKVVRNFLVALVIFGLCSIAWAADFEEDFESYAAGSQMHGQGGWAGWDGALSAGAPVSDTYAYSGANSVEIIPAADLVHEFDAAGGRWIYTTMMYIPSGGTGTSMFIMLNTYTEGGDPKDWSVQTNFNQGTGEITSEYADGTFDIIYDRWVELKMDIDLDNDTVDEYYDGQLLFTHEWDDNDHGTLQCVDLFGNSASSVYYDDITLTDVRKLAGEPFPADGATDAATEAILTWTPGSTAVTHNLYLGTDYATVAGASEDNPMGVLIGQGQSEAVFETDEPLEIDTVYYWRVDEVRQDGTIDKGFVWSFTTEPALYPVENITVVTSGATLQDQGPQNIVDGSGLDADDQHSTDTTEMWLTNFTAGIMFVQFEFEEITKLYEMQVWNHNFMFELALGLGAKDVRVDYSLNGSQWTPLGSVVFAQATGQPTYTPNTTVDFGGVPAKFVRLMITSNYGGTQVGLSEVRFLSLPLKARYPVPDDGATDVPVDTVLRWRPSRGATEHDLYLSTNANNLDLAAVTTGGSYEPEPLDLDATYYWRIDEVNDADAVSVWEGDVWSFSTQAYLVVDDFDAYVDDDDAGETIWEAWIDGLVEFGGDAANGGSQVGHNTSPFAEQTLVHTGSQSMPLYFNNGSASAISEADHAFDAAQDWTTSGIQSLSLWFYGQSDNSGRLYVKINETKIVYDGDAGDIAKTQWQPWNIDLTTSGAALSNVTALTIGVEGMGSGVVYIDDIRLYAESPQTVIPAEPDGASLVAHYAFEGNANDSSGNGYNGTASGGHLYVTGVNGQALDVDGASGYVDITNTADWPDAREPRTMSAWLLSRSVAGGWRFAVAYGTDATGQAMFIGMNGSRYYGGGYGDDVSYADYFVANEWFHCCLTYDGSTARLYGNGLELASAAKAWNLVLNQARIGQQVNPNSEFWEGAIDDVCIYNEALSAEEVAHVAGRRAVVHVPF